MSHLTYVKNFYNIHTQIFKIKSVGEHLKNIEVGVCI